MTTSPWQRRRLAVCASTELALEHWLQQQPPPAATSATPLAWGRLVVARRQRFGRGQRGRFWLSPAGGLWLSAAFPWPADPDLAAPPQLALALGLAQELEQLGLAALGLSVAIKWPNDLVVQGRKLAGLLPRLRLRGGRVRWAQLGLGLNGINRVPPGAVALGDLLQPRRGRGAGRRFDPRATPRRLDALARRAIERALRQAHQPELVRLAVEQRLWRPHQGLRRDGMDWRVEGLAADGGLRVVGPDGRHAVWRRTFP